MSSEAAEGEAAAVPMPPPIIADAVAHKYYRVPDGLKRLRSKRKVALVFAYVGERYCGLQWNHLPAYPTIEEALMKALYETDMISEVNFGNVKVQQLLNYERASRTDKGVHALCNVASVCVMLPYSPSYVAKMANKAGEATTSAPQPATCATHEADKEEARQAAEDGGEEMFSCAEAKRLLNLALPSDIHVYAVVPVTRSFNAYLNCNGRKYEYYLPSYAFMPRTAYCTDYFPAAIAPAQPTWADIGFVPSGAAKQGSTCTHHAPDMQPADNTDNNSYTNNSNSKAGDVAVAKKACKGRKNKGHFPKRRSARRRAEAAQHAEVQHDKNAKDEEGEEEEQGDEDEDDEEGECVRSETEETNETMPGVGDLYTTHFNDSLFETMMVFRDVPEEVMRRVASYRLPRAQLDHVRELFRGYEGTHCFHNFTPGGRSSDASCHRFIRSVQVHEPFVVPVDDAHVAAAIDGWSAARCFSADEDTADEQTRTTTTKEQEAASTASKTEEAHSTSDDASQRAAMREHLRRVYGEHGLEVICVEFDGQSFMLNQIRKMIGAVVCMTACDLPRTYLTEGLLRKGVRRGVPMAPANGLFLSFLDFSGYNARLARIQQNGRNGENKQSLDVHEAAQDELAEQRRRIVAVVLRNEMARDMMGKWMRSLRHVVRLAWRTELP